MRSISRLAYLRWYRITRTRYRNEYLYGSEGLREAGIPRGGRDERDNEFDGDAVGCGLASTCLQRASKGKPVTVLADVIQLHLLQPTSDVVI